MSGSRGLLYPLDLEEDVTIYPGNILKVFLFLYSQ